MSQLEPEQHNKIAIEKNVVQVVKVLNSLTFLALPSCGISQENIILQRNKLLLQVPMYYKDV